MISNQDFAAILSAVADAEKAQRATEMPTEADALWHLIQATHRLEELGWKSPASAPADTDEDLLIIEAFSSGRHKVTKIETEPGEFSWYHWDGEETWDTFPLFWRPLTEAEKASGLHTFGLDWGKP